MYRYPPYPRLFRTLAYCWIGFILLSSFYPFEWNPFGQLRLQFLWQRTRYPLLADSLFNLLGYIPLGFFGYFLSHRARSYRPLITVFLWGSALSLSCEIAQNFFVRRVPSHWDWGFNTIGVLCGALLAYRFRRAFTEVGALRYWRFAIWHDAASPLLLLLAIGLVTLFYPQPVRFNAGNWSSLHAAWFVLEPTSWFYGVIASSATLFWLLVAQLACRGQRFARWFSGALWLLLISLQMVSEAIWRNSTLSSWWPDLLYSIWLVPLAWWLQRCLPFTQTLVALGALLLGKITLLLGVPTPYYFELESAWRQLFLPHGAILATLQFLWPLLAAIILLRHALYRLSIQGQTASSTIRN